jgi:hypothetical protein
MSKLGFPVLNLLKVTILQMVKAEFKLRELNAGAELLTTNL